jgi:hypothetical protein
MPVAIAAAPIDFDRDNPSRKQFGKLTFRAGLNLYAKSAYFGGFSALAIDASGHTLLALSDAGSWFRATLDYDGRKLKGLTDGVLGPILDADRKPLRDERLRDSEGMALASGDTREGTAFVSFEQRRGTGSRAIPSTPNGSDRLPAPCPSPAGRRALSATAASKR